VISGLPTAPENTYIAGMNMEQLKALARAVEPLSGASGGFGNARQVVAYNDLVSRFRERVTTALKRLTVGEPVEAELTDELRLMAKALPGVRRAAEAATPSRQAIPAE
jgi:hypothetical protein